MSHIGEWWKAHHVEVDARLCVSCGRIGAMHFSMPDGVYCSTGQDSGRLDTVQVKVKRFTWKRQNTQKAVAASGQQEAK